MKNIFLLIFLLSLFWIPEASAVALGVNRATLNYDNVLRGGYAEDHFTATTDTPDPLGLEYEFTGDIKEWMRIEPNNESDLYFSSDNPLKITVIAEPPEDMANGTYKGELRILTGEFARTGGQFGSSIRASFAVKITVHITGNEIRSCTAGGFDIIDTEIGDPFDFHSTVQNTGNVRVKPEFVIDIWDQQHTKIAMTTSSEAGFETLPTTQNNFLDSLDHNLEIGQYWAHISDDTCGNQGILTFSILDIGGVSDKGTLLRIDNQPWADTDDIIRIAAIFKNMGTRVAQAKFKGTIEKKGKVVDVVDTDLLQVAPEQTTELETFFNPDEPGQYEVKGRVIYNNKLTFEKSSIINVKGDLAPRITGGVVARMLKNPYQLSMVVIFIAIIFLLFLIRKEKKMQIYRRRRF